MTAFLQSYGILILIGGILLFLFVFLSRREHPAQVQPTEKGQQITPDSIRNNNQHHSGGC